MDNENVLILDEVIRINLEELKDVNLDSENYKVKVDGVTKLIDRSTKLDELFAAQRDKVSCIEIEHVHKLKELNEASELKLKELDKDNEFKSVQNNKDNRIKLEQIKNDKRDKLITNIISIGGILISTVLTVWGTRKTLKFEETGTVTTSAGRSFVSKLFKK